MIPFIKGMIIPLEGTNMSTVLFQFNPQTVRGPTAATELIGIKVAGREQPVVDDVCGEVPEISFEIILTKQGRDGGYVANQIEQLRALAQPTVQGAGMKHRPRLRLMLGSRRWTVRMKEVGPETSGPADPNTLQPFYGKVSLLFWVDR